MCTHCYTNKGNENGMPQLPEQDKSDVDLCGYYDDEGNSKVSSMMETSKESKTPLHDVMNNITPSETTQP